MTRRFLLAALAAALGTRIAPAGAAPALRIVASFSILADLVREVGGDRVQVQALVGPGGDAHVFSPAPGDARRIAAADLVFVNGLGFEGWIDRLVRAAGTKAPVIVASRGVAPLPAGPGEGGADPHAWQDVANVRIYVENIRDALSRADPAGRALYAAAAADYLNKLEALDRDIRAGIATIPPARRKVITTHDAFFYFQRAYGIRFIAPEGVSTDTEASAGAVAAIARQIKAQQIPAVFLESITDNRITRQIAKETGARIGGELYSDALSGPDGPAPTYIAMMRHNLRELVVALAPRP